MYGFFLLLSLLWTFSAAAEPVSPEQSGTASPQQTALPEPSLRFSREFSRTYAEYGDTVTLSYTLRNSGEVAIENLVVSDSLIGEVGRVERLEPGERKTLSARVKVTGSMTSIPAVSYECGGKAYSDGRSPETIYLANVALRVELSADKTNVAPGEVVTLRLKLVNEGNVSFYGLRADEPILGEMGSLVGTLPPGEECVATRTVPMKSMGTFQFSVSGTSDTGGQISAHSNELSVVVTPVAAQVELNIRAEADRTELNGPGEVVFSIYVNNECALELRDVFISEATRGEVRRLLFVPSGEMPPITQSYEVKESGVYQFTAQVADSVGDQVTVYSQPVEIQVLGARADLPDVTPDSSESVIPVLDGASYRMDENAATFERLMIGTGALLLSAILVGYVAADIRRSRARRRARKNKRKKKIKRIAERK